MANENINKVVYGNDTLIDLTSDSVSPQTLLAGETAHDRSGTQIVGSAKQGHTIIDASGTSMATESGLQFATMKVEDDSTNGKTVVRHIIPVTKAQYDALPSTKNSDNIIYEITDYDPPAAQGGHTIKDASGTAVTQEPDLQFKTALVTDENGVTVVRNVVSLTQAQYDQITPISGVIYEITDSDAQLIQANSVGYEGGNVKNKLDTLDTLGAKNLLPITASSLVVGNLTFTVNLDNSVTVSGSGEYYYTLCTIERDDFNKYYAGKTMTVSGTPASILSTNFRVFGSVSGGSNIIDESANPTALMPTVNNNVIFYIRIVGSVNTTFRPMLRLSTDTVATYAPYAKTNNELTDDVKTINQSISDAYPPYSHTAVNIADTNTYTTPAAGMLHIRIDTNGHSNGMLMVDSNKWLLYPANNSGVWSRSFYMKKGAQFKWYNTPTAQDSATFSY